MRLVLSGVILTALLIPTVARSQPSDDEMQSQLARFYFDKAEAAFRAEKFADAIASYSKSFGVSKAPVLMFNVGLCHEKLGNKREAIAAFRRYLELEPEGRRAEEARLRIRALEADLKPEPASDRPLEPATTDEKPAGRTVTLQLHEDEGEFELTFATNGGEVFTCKTTFVTPCAFRGVRAGPASLRLSPVDERPRASLSLEIPADEKDQAYRIDYGMHWAYEYRRMLAVLGASGIVVGGASIAIGAKLLVDDNGLGAAPATLGAMVAVAGIVFGSLSIWGYSLEHPAKLYIASPAIGAGEPR